MSTVDWEITQKCNMRCNHCIGNYTIASPKELTYLQKKEYVNRFIDMGCKQINFTGGEPFCSDDFTSIVQYCLEKGIMVSVITNGEHLHQIPNELLSRFCSIGISVDSDYIRGLGAMKRSFSLLKMISKSNLPISICTTVCKETLEDLAKIISYSYECNFKDIRINDIVHRGRAKNKILDFSMVTIVDILEKINSYVKVDNIIEIRNCTVDGKSCFCSSDGALFYCTEIYQCNRDLDISKISQLSFGGICCYDEFVINKEISICLRNKNECSVLLKNGK